MRELPRGQTLILFALTMMLLVLMVCMTLSIGMKVRENHELQTLADAGAYSNAVATARAYNNVSILNRLMVSTWVAQAGAQSYISWTSWARAAFKDAKNTADDLSAANADGCNPSGVCCTTGTGVDAFGNTYSYCITYCLKDPNACTASKNAAALATEIQTQYDGFFSDDTDWFDKDRAAGKESREIQLSIIGMRTATDDITGAVGFGFLPPPNPAVASLREVLDQQTMTQKVLKAAAPGFRTGELSVHTDNGVNLREALCTSAAPGTTGACKAVGWREMVEDAAMGTRLREFTTGRGSTAAPSAIAAKLATLTKGTVTIGAPKGSGYWGVWGPGGQERYGDPSLTAAWGDDHDGVVTVAIPPPGGILSLSSTRAMSRVMSTNFEDTQDKHDWSPGMVAHPAPGEIVYHNMTTCAPFCSTVWVWPIGFQDGPASDANGQPKNYSVIERDLLSGGRTASTGRGNNTSWDPWNLFFRFRFTPAGAQFDNRGIYTHGANGKNDVDISRSVAFGTGMAYYHRKNPDPNLSWRECPNFLNPFWRATLVRANVDAQSNKDIPDILGGNWQAEAYTELRNAGFRGQH